MWNVLWRYGTYSLSFGWMTKSFLKNFNKVYEAQKNGEAFESPEDLLKFWDMYDFTQKDIKTLIKVNNLIFLSFLNFLILEGEIW